MMSGYVRNFIFRNGGEYCYYHFHVTTLYFALQITNEYYKSCVHEKLT